MKSDEKDVKLHRGSSPPFQYSVQGGDDSATRLQAPVQSDERPSALQLVMNLGFEQIESTTPHVNPPGPKRGNSESESIADRRSRQDKDDVTRWQDDGGESGEAV